MARCSEHALELAIAQLSEFAKDNVRRSNWVQTYLAASRMRVAGYPNNISGANQAVDDLFVLLPDHEHNGRINPFFPSDTRWMSVDRSGRKTVWNTATRNGKQTVLFDRGHMENGLRDDAIDVLLANLTDADHLPSRIALAVFLTRDTEWSAEPSPDQLVDQAAEFIGLEVSDFNRITEPMDFDAVILEEPEWDPALLAESTVGPPKESIQVATAAAASTTTTLISTDLDEAVDLLWTKEQVSRPMRDSSVEDVSHRVLALLDRENIVLPDAERLVRRCVTALLLGHLILQGPPGTGKTTLARALGIAFEVDLLEATATSEWSPFHVVGGYRPNSSGGLTPTHGKVVDAILQCALRVRGQTDPDAVGDLHPEDPQGSWLFIDEFNRADIDKAIGSLYTLLSSCDPSHLTKTPVDLWFEEDPQRSRIWAPSRFRIIGAMNDLDTSFVNQISQGLTRRFHFVTVPAPRPTGIQQTEEEVTSALRQAHTWLGNAYPDIALGTLDDTKNALQSITQILSAVITAFRAPQDLPGWPIGTAQLVDILKYLLLSNSSETITLEDLDEAIADRLVPQLSQVDDQQDAAFKATLLEHGLTRSVAALSHLLNPHSI